eukprot:SAG31_NODE_3883_length_3786_cov_3.919989_2_plen_203_part_00
MLSASHDNNPIESAFQNTALHHRCFDVCQEYLLALRLAIRSGSRKLFDLLCECSVNASDLHQLRACREATKLGFLVVSANGKIISWNGESYKPEGTYLWIRRVLSAASRRFPWLLPQVCVRCHQRCTHSIARVLSMDTKVETTEKKRCVSRNNALDPVLEKWPRPHRVPIQHRQEQKENCSSTSYEILVIHGLVVDVNSHAE